MPQIVVNYWLDQYQTMGNTLTDISFDCLPFLNAKEPIYNMKGQKVSKSYYDQNGREAVRIVYSNIYGDFTYNDVVYNNVFLGLKKQILFMDWAGEIAYTKYLQPYFFNLEPVILADGNYTVAGFSSKKQREILKRERVDADNWLSSQNPTLYAILYDRYVDVYSCYLRTGFKENFVTALNSETNPDIITVLNKEVAGYEPMTVLELIELNLQ